MRQHGGSRFNECGISRFQIRQKQWKGLAPSNNVLVTINHIVFKLPATAKRAAESPRQRYAPPGRSCERCGTNTRQSAKLTRAPPQDRKYARRSYRPLFLCP